MKNFGRGISKTLLFMLAVVIMTVSMILPASAATYTAPVFSVDASGTLTKITFQIKYDSNGTSDRHNVIIPETMNGKKIVKIASNVLTGNNSVEAITIPSTVTTIEASAFTGCNNLKKIVINNYEGAVNIAANAFPASAQVTYTQEKPTEAPTTPQPTVPPTAAPTAPATVTPSAKPTQAAKPVTPTKKTATPSKAADKVKEEVTEELTTETPAETIIDSTPFASAKAELSDIHVWDQLVSPATEEASAPQVVKNPALNTASYAAVVVVSFSAIVLGYFKFRR